MSRVPQSKRQRELDQGHRRACPRELGQDLALERRVLERVPVGEQGRVDDLGPGVVGQRRDEQRAPDERRPEPLEGEDLVQQIAARGAEDAQPRGALLRHARHEARHPGLARAARAGDDLLELIDEDQHPDARRLDPLGEGDDRLLGLEARAPHHGQEGGVRIGAGGHDVRRPRRRPCARGALHDRREDGGARQAALAAPRRAEEKDDAARAEQLDRGGLLHGAPEEEVPVDVLEAAEAAKGSDGLRRERGGAPGQRAPDSARARWRRSRPTSGGAPATARRARPPPGRAPGGHRARAT